MPLPRQASIEQYRRFFPYLAPDKGFAPLLTFCILGIALSNTALIWFISQPFNHLANSDFDALSNSLLWLALIVVLNQLFHFSSTLLSNWLGLRLVGRLRNTVMDRLTRFAFPPKHHFSKGDLLSRSSVDVDKVQELMVALPSFMVSHAATIMLYSFMLFWLDAHLALVAVSLALLFLLHYKLFARRKEKVSQAFLQKNAALLTHEEETLSNLRGINSYTAETQFQHSHEQRFNESFSWAMKARWLDSSFHVSFSLLVFFCAIFIVYVGVNQIAEDKIQLGSLISFLLYLGYLSVPVKGIAQSSYAAQEALASCQRLGEILQFQTPLPEADDAAALKVDKGDIQLSKLSFAYDENKTVLHDVNLHIAGGSTVAIVGPSGSGKSTLAYLLMRFYDPQSGEICIDAQNIKQVSLHSLRTQIAAVWQTPFLFSDSIRNNLLLARQDASEQQLIDACKAAHAWEFIQQLPQQLDTRIGSNGTQLSVGQQQRLSIAQAFLRDAPILILDEASSALDSEAEAKLLDAIQHLRHGRTTLIIAHRYSSLRLAQQVIYLNSDGSISSGSHEELMQSHQGYRDAVSWQTEMLG